MSSPRYFFTSFFDKKLNWIRKLMENFLWHRYTILIPRMLVEKTNTVTVNVTYERNESSTAVLFIWSSLSDVGVFFAEKFFGKARKKQRIASSFSCIVQPSIFPTRSESRIWQALSMKHSVVYSCICEFNK